MPQTSDFKRRFSLVEREEIVSKAHRCLWTDAGKPGKVYLTKRGLSDETMREFQLGYIPDSVQHQLRGRIILPLFDPSENLITVGSRAIESGGFLPVYWHESYEKTFYLYGIERAREALRRHKFAVVCLDGDQEIVDPSTGKIKTIRCIQVGDKVLSYNNGCNYSGKVMNKFFNGHKKCFKIRTNKNEIVATSDHVFYANGRWVKLNNLRLGDLLISPLRHSVENSNQCLNSLGECRLLGYMIGDGYCVGSPMFTNTNRFIIQDFKNLIDKLGDRIDQRDNRHYMIYGKQARGGYKQVTGRCLSNIQKFLDRNQIRNKLAYNKVVPSFVFSAKNKYVKEVLNGLFDSDGTVDKDRNKISYSTTSNVLAQQIKLLLLRFAVKSRINKITYDNPNHRDGYVVTIAGESASRLASVLELRHPVKNSRLKNILTRKSHKCDQLYPVVDYIRKLCIERGIKFRQLLDRSNLSRSTLSRQYISMRHMLAINTILKDPFLDELSSGNIFASQIVSIEECGVKPVYDLQIESFKNFYVNDILVHNCEGQFDVLQLHNHGVRNAIGLCGNKMSSVQISIIQRYCTEIVLLLDVDQNRAGQMGAHKILAESSAYDYSNISLGASSLPMPLSTFEPQTMASRPIISVILPENSDPDEYIRAHGIEALKKLVKGKRREYHNG